MIRRVFKPQKRWRRPVEHRIYASTCW